MTPARAFCLLAATLWLSGASAAQESRTVSRGDLVALLWHESPNDRKAFAGLERGLKAAGLPAPILLEAGEEEPRARRLLAAAEESGAALVVALGTRAAQLARENTSSVPIVFTAVTNPVISGVVRGWEGSGDRVCGNSNWLDRETMLEAFRLAVPGCRRLAVLASEGNAVSAAEIEEATGALRERRDLELRPRILGKDEDLDRVLDEVLAEADALWIPIDFDLYQEATFARIVARATERRVPVVSSSEKCAGRGALCVVTVDYELLGLRAAALVRRVLRGGKNPGEMPVGRLSSSRIYVDLAAARRLDLELPLELVLGAWRVFGREAR